MSILNISVGFELVRTNLFKQRVISAGPRSSFNPQHQVFTKDGDSDPVAVDMLTASREKSLVSALASPPLQIRPSTQRVWPASLRLASFLAIKNHAFHMKETRPMNQSIFASRNQKKSFARAAALFMLAQPLSGMLPPDVSAQTIPNQGRTGTGAVTYPPTQGNECLSLQAGGLVLPPRDMFSSNGVLSVALNYYTSLDSKGRTLYCFVTPDGHVAPTLHVKPGDVFKLAVTNRVPAGMLMETVKTSCGESVMYDSSLNIHFHGALVSPKCTKDNVIDTVINSGDTFQYTINIPVDEPPGLYWYHPHLHGLADSALLGGASAALIVDGIQHFQPMLAGMPQRLLILRDQVTVGAVVPPGQQDQYGVVVPTWDVSLNYVPVSYSPGVTTAAPLIEMKAGRPELWRVVNASSDSILDFQVLYDGIPQPLKVVGLDGVPTGSQDGNQQGSVLTRSTISMPPAARAEFIVNPPGAGVKDAVFKTLTIDTGPVGDSVPSRTLAVLRTTVNGTALPVLPAATGTWPQRFENIDPQPIAANRKLYFSEVLSDPNNPAGPTDFFITEAGKTPVKYASGNSPAIVTTQGNVEEWTIENHAAEKHVFHIHQIHFKLQAINGVTLPAQDQQFYDDYAIDYWKGPGYPYPSIKVKMDFRGPIVGDFVYHCHILGHEDNGMMAVIRVLPHR